MNDNKTHQFFMGEALKQAKLSFQYDEVPIGAVLVYQNKIIASGHNLSIANHDPSAHAEILTIRDGGQYLKNYRLLNCSLYVTLEPCVMCAGALAWARPKRVIFGAFDAKRGFTMVDESILHKKTELSTGVLIEPCGKILTQFFEEKRKLD